MSAGGSQRSGGSWLPEGTRLNEMYAIDAGIAAGGMGEIYRGHNIQTGDLVAIKMIRNDVADTESAMMLFRKEASALHNLYHESIVRYYGFSVDPGLNRPYLAMEFVDGVSISDWLKNGPMSFDQVRVLAARVASGLQVAHERGIIHRDISPDNIIIPEQDVAKAKIIDFGIARQTKASHGTVIGDGFAGKYNYVSPEQLGMFNGDVTGRSDIYSLGLVLSEAIAGRSLNMRGSPLEVIEKRRVVPDISHLDPRIQPLIGWMLQPNPDDRPQSMNEVVGWLRRGSMQPGPSWGGYGQDEPDRTVAIPGGARPSPMQGGPMQGGQWPGDYAAAQQPRGPSQWPQDQGVSQRGPTQGQGRHPSQWPQDQGSQRGPAGGFGPHPSQWPQEQPGSQRGPMPTGQGSGWRPADGQGSQPPMPLRDRRAPRPAVGKKSGSAGLIGAAAAVVLMLLGGGGYWFMTQGKPAVPGTTTADVTPGAGGGGTPVAPKVEEAAPEVRPEDVRRYLADYRKGDCTFLNPIVVADNQAMTEGYGRSAQPFQALDSEFRKTFGFGAGVLMRPVAEAQCPVVNLLAETRPNDPRRPRLEVVAGTVRAGDWLAGEAQSAAGSFVSVFLLEDDGSMRVLVKPVRPGGEAGAAFLAKVRRQGGEGDRPQLVLALATAQALPVLQSEEAMTAARFVELLGEQAANSGDKPSVSAQYLTVQR